MQQAEPWDLLFLKGHDYPGMNGEHYRRWEEACVCSACCSCCQGSLTLP